MDHKNTIAPSKVMENTKAEDYPATMDSTKAIDHTETLERTKSMTPPATPSRASTASAIDSIECSIAMVTTATGTTPMDTSATPGPVEFKPLQMLMSTPIEIECGPDLATKLTVHEELLRCHSTLLDERYTKAKFERDAIADRSAFQAAIATYVYPVTPAKRFVDSNAAEKVIPLIIRAYENYPWGHHELIKKNIDAAIEYELAEKNTKSPLATTAGKKKPKEMTLNITLRGRLDLLKARGVQNVASELFSLLFRIQKSETAKAKDDPLKAAARGRLLLPNFEESTVRSFMQWIYGGILEDHGAEELYSLMMLATELQVVALTEACLSKLCNAISDSMQQAQTRGMALRTLLGFGSESATAADSFVSTVFGHAFKDKNMPRRLFKLVINILAEGMDTELFAVIKELVSHEMAMQLLEAMIARPKIIKAELYGQPAIKSESEEARAEKSPQAG